MGSIPAYAGEPGVIPGGDSSHGVYPRVCGGTPDIRDNPSVKKGLSPRMRGNRVIISPYQRVWRSIPAYAGEPRASHGGGIRSGVYPRVCGGTAFLHFLQVCHLGLSPRMRGNPDLVMARGQRVRSIPAYAGEPST